MRGAILAAAFLAAVPVSGAMAQTAAAPIPVTGLDIDRYSGLWHEMARYPNPAQSKDCVNPTAEYGYDDDGNIAIVDTCSNMQGVVTSTTLGTATQIGARGDATFSVDYGDGQAGDYWVVAIASDYSWSIVSVPERDRLWILTREPVTGGPTMTALLGKVRELGFDTTKLFYSQKGGINLTSSLELENGAGG